MARRRRLCQDRVMSEPDQRLFFLLQRAAHRLRVDADRRCLAMAGVTTAQLGALFAVAGQPGITQRQLAGVLGVRESGVTPLVGRLTAAGLLARRPHPSEHRAIVLELTDEGAAALRDAQVEIDRFNAELRALLGETGFAATAAALHALAYWND